MRALPLILMGTGARPAAILEMGWEQMDYEHGLIQLNPAGRVQTKKVRPIVKMPNVPAELRGEGRMVT